MGYHGCPAASPPPHSLLWQLPGLAAPLAAGREGSASLGPLQSQHNMGDRPCTALCFVGHGSPSLGMHPC